MDLSDGEEKDLTGGRSVEERSIDEARQFGRIVRAVSRTAESATSASSEEDVPSVGGVLTIWRAEVLWSLEPLGRRLRETLKRHLFGPGRASY